MYAPGNWWGNGEPIFMMAVKHDYLIPAEQDPHRETDCAIRNVHIDGVTCMGENAMGIYGVDGNIREVELRNIDFTRKPSKNLPLKGNVFDFAPGRVDFEVPEDAACTRRRCGREAGEHQHTCVEDHPRVKGDYHEKYYFAAARRAPL